MKLGLGSNVNKKNRYKDKVDFHKRTFLHRLILTQDTFTPTTFAARYKTSKLHKMYSSKANFHSANPNTFLYKESAEKKKGRAIVRCLSRVSFQIINLMRD